LCQSRAFLTRAGRGAAGLVVLGQDRDKALRERQHYEEKLQDLQSARPGGRCHDGCHGAWVKWMVVISLQKVLVKYLEMQFHLQMDIYICIPAHANGCQNGAP
jgi:hypothetical protein